MITNVRKIAIFACGLPALYFAVMAAFGLYHFGDFASETPQLLRYVVVPGILAGLLVIAVFTLSSETAFKTGASVCAVLAGLFAFETLMSVQVLGVLTGQFESDKSALATAAGPKGLPPSDTIKGLNHKMGITQLNEAMLGGLPNSHVLLCRKGDKAITYVADRFGFNNPDNLYGRPASVMVIGDSFVEGMCQEPGQDLTAQLRSKVPDSVSFGTRGAGPLFELAMLGRYGPMLKPRHVVLVFFEGNDWENLEKELKLPWLRTALIDGADFGDAAPPPKMISAAEEVIQTSRQTRAALRDVLFRSSFVRNYFALNQTATQLGLAYPKVSPEIPQFDAVLRRAKALTGTWGGTLHLAYVPQSVRYVGALPRDFVYEQLHGRVLDAARRADINVIDLVDIFAKQEEPAALYGADVHLNEKGAGVMADAIARQVMGPKS